MGSSSSATGSTSSYRTGRLRRLQADHIKDIGWEPPSNLCSCCAGASNLSVVQAGGRCPSAQTAPRAGDRRGSTVTSPVAERRRYACNIGAGSVKVPWHLVRPRVGRSGAHRTKRVGKTTLPVFGPPRVPTREDLGRRRPAGRAGEATAERGHGLSASEPVPTLSVLNNITWRGLVRKMSRDA